MHELFYKIAKKSLRNHRRRTVYLFISVLVVTFLNVALMSFVDSTVEQNYLNNQQKYGSYYYAVIDCTDEQREMLEQNPFLSISKTHCYATFNGGNIGYVEDIQLLPMSLYLGDWPQKEDEIVMSKDVLIRLGYPLEIGKPIALDCQLLDGTHQERDFVLCGILNPNLSSMDGNLEAVTIRKDDKATTNLYYISEDGPLIEGNNLHYNTNAIPEILGESYENYYQRQFMLVSLTFIGAVMIMLSLNNVASEIEDELALLRGVGASKMQVAMLIFYQVGLVACLAIPLGFILSVGTVYLLCQGGNVVFHFRMESILIILVSLVLMIFIGTALPAIKASTASLTGRLRHKKLELKIRRFQKRTPYRLSRRHMHFQKWQNVVFVFVLSCLLVYLSGNIFRLQKSIRLENDQSNTQGSVLFFETMDIQGAIEWTQNIQRIIGIDDVMVMYTTQSDIEVEQKDGMIETAPVFVLDTNEKALDQEALISKEKALLVFDGKNASSNYYSKSYAECPLTAFEDTIEFDQWSENEQSAAFLDHFPLPSYAMIVSMEYAKQEELELANARIVIKLKDGVNVDDVLSGIIYLQNQYDVEFFNSSMPQMPSDIFSSRLKLVVYSLTAVIAMILLVYQRISIQLKQRNRELGIFQAVGMEKSKVVRMITYEGITLGALAVITATVFKLLPYLITYMNNDYAYGHASWKETFLGLSQVEVSIFCIVSVICFVALTLAYYLPARHVVSGRLIDKIRYKE